jgi:glycosyltransferase 2 family protein
MTRLERAGHMAARAGSLQPSDPRVRRGLHAGIAIVVALSVGLAVFATLGDLPEVDWRFRPLGPALVVIGFGSCLIAHAEIWRRILAALGPELPVRRSYAIWFTSGLGRYVPTSLLLPVLRAAMSERVGVPKRVCLASMTYEAAFVFTGALILGAYFVVDLPALQGAPGRFLVVALPVLALVALHPRIFHPLADRALNRLGREKLPMVLPMGRVLEFVGLYTLTYVVAGLSVYGLAQVVYPVGSDDLAIFVGAFAVGTTLSVIAFVLPGGVIAREAGIAVALSPVMPAGPAIAVAVLARIVQLGLELIGALVAPLVARRGADGGSNGSGP